MSNANDFSTGAATYTTSIDGVAAKVMALGELYNDTHDARGGLYMRCTGRRVYTATWQQAGGEDCWFYAGKGRGHLPLVGKGPTMHWALQDLAKRLEAATEER